MIHHRLAHFDRGLHLNHFHPARRGQIHRTGNQHHARAPRRGLFGQRVSHLAAGPVGDVAHRVQRLLRRSGGDQHRLAFQILRTASLDLDQLRGDRLPRSSLRGSASLPGPTMPQASAPSSGSTITWPRSRRIAQILLRRRMIPHVRVHRRRQHHGSGERQIDGGQKIVGEPVREFREQIRGGRRDHQNLILLRHADVFDRARKRVLGARRRKTGW